MTTITNTLDTFDQGDAALLKKLGLRSDNVDLWKEACLGTVDLDGEAQVSVWVTSTPSLFFRFEINFQGTRKSHSVQTASGAFSDYWNMVTAFVNGSLTQVTGIFDVKELVFGVSLSQPESLAGTAAETAELLQDCSNCGTVYQFTVTKEQALRYQPPRTEVIQDIFPEIPIPARAVLTQGNICGLCLPQLDESVKDTIRTFIVDSAN